MASRIESNPLSCCAIPETIQDALSNVPEINEVNMISKKMQDISLKEREEATYELHGLADVVEETDELVAKTLTEMDLEAKKIPNTYAMDLAKSKSLGYVLKMRILFLRCESFDPQLAAKRMANFFDMKLSLFGEENIAKDITFWDLTEEDRESLEQGGLQLLSLKDRAGRAVLFRIAFLFTGLPLETQGRLLYFVVMKALEDEDVQKRGLVLVLYNVGMDKFFTGGALVKFQRYNAFPGKLSGIHLCYDNGDLETLVKFSYYILDKNNTARFRTHFGTHVECLYTLMTFGIIREVIPIDAKGEVNLEFHKMWMKRIKVKPTLHNEESLGTTRKKIIVPGTMDIILGRGSHAKNSPGNLRFRHLLETHRHHYDALCPKDRTIITETILLELKQANIRFIKRGGGEGYIEISESEAKAKISHGFRNLRTHVESSNASVKENSKKKRPSVEGVSSARGGEVRTRFVVADRTSGPHSRITEETIKTKNVTRKA